jgi:hypothetical protein
MERRLRKTLLVILCLLIPAVCLADTAFKWTDSQGRIVFGSRPPKDATGVSAVKAKNYSRYSPSPVLAKAFKKEARASLRSSVKEKELPLPPAPPLDSFDIRKEIPTKQTQLELSVDSPQVKIGDSEEITACSVTVKNKTPIDIEGIQVSFEFADGTLLPATGPMRLNIGQAALFSISAEQLPVKLQVGANTTPKVIVNTDNEVMKN